MKKTVKIVFIFALGALVVIQFIRPDKNEAGYEGVEHFENETNLVHKWLHYYGLIVMIVIAIKPATLGMLK